MSPFYKKMFCAGILFSSILGKAQTFTNVDIGTGTDGTDNSPIQRFYSYSASELIYLGSEINTTGYLRGIGFYKASGSATETIDSVYIYAKTTTATVATLTTSTAGYTPVYAGAFPNNVTSGWVSVNFTLNSLQFSSTSNNLSILIIRPFQTLTSNRPFYRYTDNIGGNRNGWYRNSSGPFSGTMNEVSGWRPNVRLIFGTTPLPITLGNISAVNKGTQNLVEWNTLTEETGDKFELEKSTDGIQFKMLQSIAAKGTAPATYSYPDQAPQPGANYYRLKLVNKDGKIAHSKVVKANYLGSKGIEIITYPNPAVSSLSVTVKGAGHIQVLTLDGKTLSNYTVGASGKLNMPVSNLGSGTYLLKFTDAQQQSTTQLFTKE